MNRSLLFALSLLAAPTTLAEDVDAEAQTEDEVSASEETDGEEAAGLGPLAFGFVIGEPTALRVDYYIDEQTRAVGLLGMAHRSKAYSFEFDAPLIMLGAERDLMLLPELGSRSGAISAGLQLNFWMRSFYVSQQPMAALELPVSLRLSNPFEPLAFFLTVAPGYYLTPGPGPSFAASVGFSYRLPLPGATGSRAPVEEETAKEEAIPEPEPAKVEPKKKAKPKPKPKRKGRRRLSR